MKRTILFLLSLLTLLTITACNKVKELEDNYNDESFGYIDVGKNDIKIMQLTDVHLSYGFDALDKKTYKLINALVESEKPDVIVITGDLFMSVYAKRILKKFIKFMETFKIPWAYTFGNHEGEYHSMTEIVNVLLNANTKYLNYHYGPKLSDDNTHGYSNYKLKLTNGNYPLLNLYLLDTKANRIDGVVDKDYPYDYLSIEQVNWYNELVKEDIVDSLAFMHIPLMQYELYEGEKNERVWAQGKDTGFFQAILDNNKKTLGVFVGHDHENNHTFYLDDILLAYGISSGFNAYGENRSKGARIVNYNYDTKVLTTKAVYRDEVLK